MQLTTVHGASGPLSKGSTHDEGKRDVDRKSQERLQVPSDASRERTEITMQCSFQMGQLGRFDGCEVWRGKDVGRGKANWRLMREKWQPPGPGYG